MVVYSLYNVRSAVSFKTYKMMAKRYKINLSYARREREYK